MLLLEEDQLGPGMLSAAVGRKDKAVCGGCRLDRKDLDAADCRYPVLPRPYHCIMKTVSGHHAVP